MPIRPPAITNPAPSPVSDAIARGREATGTVNRAVQEAIAGMDGIVVVGGGEDGGPLTHISGPSHMAQAFLGGASARTAAPVPVPAPPQSLVARHILHVGTHVNAPVHFLPPDEWRHMLPPVVGDHLEAIVAARCSPLHVAALLGAEQSRQPALDACASLVQDLLILRSLCRGKIWQVKIRDEMLAWVTKLQAAGIVMHELPNSRTLTKFAARFYDDELFVLFAADAHVVRDLIVALPTRAIPPDSPFFTLVMDHQGAQKFAISLATMMTYLGGQFSALGSTATRDEKALCVEGMLRLCHREDNVTAWMAFGEAIQSFLRSDDVAEHLLARCVELGWEPGLRATIALGANVSFRKHSVMPGSSKDWFLPTALHWLASSEGSSASRIAMVDLLIRGPLDVRALGITQRTKLPISALATPISAHVEACLFGDMLLAKCLAQEIQQAAHLTQDADTQQVMALSDGLSDALAALTTNFSPEALAALKAYISQLNACWVDHGMFSASTEGCAVAFAMLEMQDVLRGLDVGLRALLSASAPQVTHDAGLANVLEAGSRLTAVLVDFVNAGQLKEAEPAGGRSSRAPGSTWAEAAAAGSLRDTLTSAHVTAALPPTALLTSWAEDEAALRYLETVPRLPLGDAVLAWTLLINRPTHRHDSEAGREETAARSAFLKAVVRSLPAAYALAETALVTQSEQGLNEVGRALKASKVKSEFAQLDFARAYTLLWLAVGTSAESVRVVGRWLKKGPALEGVFARVDEAGDNLLHMGARQGQKLLQALLDLVGPTHTAREARNTAGRTPSDEARAFGFEMPMASMALAEDEPCKDELVHAIEVLRLEAPKPATQSEQTLVDAAPLAWANKVLYAANPSARATAVTAFLQATAPTSEAQGRMTQEQLREANSEAWRIMDVLHYCSHRRAMGAHFEAHLPNVDRDALVRRVVRKDLNLRTASAFDAQDGLALLRLRQQAYGLAVSAIADNSTLAHEVELRDRNLASRGVRVTSDGAPPIDLPAMDTVRFILARQRGKAELLMVGCFPVPRDPGSHLRLGKVRARSLAEQVCAAGDVPKL